MANIKILLADDHKIVRDGIKLMLQPITGIEVVAEANNGNEVMEILDRTGIDLIIMDINMPGMDGIQAARKVKERMSDTKILALTMSNDDLNIRQMIQAGGSLLGGIGVSGAPGGDANDVCAPAGLKAIADDLEF